MKELTPTSIDKELSVVAKQVLLNDQVLARLSSGVDEGTIDSRQTAK